jgi:hypothetical protein
MRQTGFDTAVLSERPHRPRKSARTALKIAVEVRQPGNPKYRVFVHDLSPHGCKLDLVERPTLNQSILIKFAGLQALEAIVCWLDGFTAGVELKTPLHPAVFLMLVEASQRQKSS